MAPPPPPLTDLIEDVTAEIFLRLPPDEPEHLLRAAFVCKPWLRILCDPGFLRRYRAFHGAPPLLGLLHIHNFRICSGEPFPRLVTTTSAPVSPQPAGTYRRTRLLDCRHGRVLVFIHTWKGLAQDMGDGYPGYLLVWDPVTGDIFVSAIFVSTGVGLFTIELTSGRVKKVDEPATGFGDYFSVLPYMSFYTPGCGTLSSLARLADV